MFAAGALLAAGGCAQPARFSETTAPPVDTRVAASQPAADDWAPPAVPPDFDRQKALLPLSKVPGDPPAPAATGQTADAELPRQALQHIDEARRLFSELRYSETIQELERALRYNANSYEAHRMMALAALLSGDDDRARASAERALAIKPNDLASHYVLGRTQEKAGKKDDALREYRLALKSESADKQAPYRLLANYYLGNLLYESGYYAAAVEQLTAFEAGLAALGGKSPDDPELATLARVRRPEVAIRVATAYTLLGDYTKAAGSLKAALAFSPKDDTLRAEYIRMLGRAHRLDEAAREAAQYVTDTNGSRQAVELLLAVHRHAGHPEQALQVIRQLALAQPDNTDLWKLYVDALAAAKRFDEAVATLNEFVSRHPDAADSRWWLIQLTRQRGDWPKWLSALAQHLQNQPQDYARVDAEFSRLPLETARKMAAEIDSPVGPPRLLPAKPADDKAASALDVLLARLDTRLNQPQKAQALLEQALKRTPGFPPAVIGLAESQVAACRWKETIDTIQAKAKGLPAPSARLEYLLGRAYDGLDDTEAAIEHYNKAADLDKTDIDSLLMLGRVYERIGRGKDAGASYQKAIAAAPENMRARELLVRQLLTQAAQEGRPNSRIATEVKDMQRIAPQDPATVRTAAVAQLVSQGEAGRKTYLDTLRNLVHNHPDDARSREDLVAILLAVHEYPDARRQGEELVKIEPCSADAGELLAVACMRLLDFPAAAADLNRTLAVYPNREALLTRSAQVALVKQDYDTAIKTYHRLLDLKCAAQRQASYRHALVETYREARRFEQARQEIESWLEKAQGNTEIERLRQYLLAIDAAAGDCDRYVARVREWLKADPDNDNLRALLIGSDSGTTGPVGLIGQKRYDEAILLGLRWLGQDIQSRPRHQLVHMGDLRLVGRLLTALQGAGRNAEAVELARAQVAAAKDEDERSTAQLLLRAVYLRAGKMDEVIRLTEEMISANQDESLTDERLLVNLLSHAGRFDDAVNHVNKLLDNLDQQKTQIEAFAKNNTDPRRGQLIQQAMTQLTERRALLLRTLSYVYQRAGESDVAKEQLREAYKLDPTDVGVNNDLGYMLADSGDNLEEGERMVRTALAEQPRQAAYQDSYAWVLYKKGDLNGARTWLLRATAMDEGQDPVVYDHLADVQWRMGDQNAARKSWRKSLETYEVQSRLGETEVEKDLVDRVKTKLAAAEAGRNPKVAPTAAETRPAP